MEWMKCKTVSPNTDAVYSAHQVVKMENCDIGRLIVNGYMRYIVMNTSISLDIMRLIMSYYSNNEWICVFYKLSKILKQKSKKSRDKFDKDMAEKRHSVSCWMISINAILSNLSDDPV